MISGFNTDIEFDGVVYHVQTEDKGLSTRKIISLVYDGGTILASKRTSYEDLSGDAHDANVLAERVQRQHKLMCAAIKAGRIDDLKHMTAKAGAVSVRAAVEVPPLVFEPMITADPLPNSRSEPRRLSTLTVSGVAEPLAYSTPIEKPAADLQITFAKKTPLVDDLLDVPMLGDDSIIDFDLMFPPEAVVVVSELSGIDRPSNSKLNIELLGNFKFKGGDRLTVNMLICRGTDRKIVTNAQIMIKVLGSSFRPVIFHAKSDSNGLAKVHLQLPHFSSGRAALMVRAVSAGEEVELRRIVAPG